MLFFKIYNPKTQGVLMLKRFKLKKIKGIFFVRGNLKDKHHY